MHISNFTITCIKLSLFCGLINLAILRVATAQNNESPPSVQIETVQTKPNNSLESSVLAEINRARTDPLGYAAWLEQQKQYYQGIVLALPGEKPLRINKGLKALEEAIAFLQQQKPLPALTTSDVLTENARTQVAAIARREANSNINIDNITYGRVTPEGIVMELIVDSRSPNRHHRTSLFNPQANATGILCQRDPQYENICAIAYEGDGTNIASNELSTAASPEVEESSPSSKANSTDRPREIQIETVNNESPVETTPSNTTPQVIEVPQPETKPSSSPSTTTANTSDNAPLLNKIERGTLDTGDKTIPDDGSFYDSYPLEGKAGESFIITLESDDFDTFLALMDPKGTILEQNDDIDDKNSNSLLRITLPDDGVYSLIINAYNEGGKGEYVLTVRH